MQKRKDLSISISYNKKYKNKQDPYSVSVETSHNIEGEDRIKNFVKIEKEMIKYAIKSYQKQINNLSDALAQSQIEVVIYMLEKANKEAYNLIPVLNMIHIKVLKEAVFESEFEVCTEMLIKVFSHILKEAKQNIKNITEIVSQENIPTYSYVIEKTNNAISIAQKQIHTLTNAFKLIQEYPSKLEKAYSFLSKLTNDIYYDIDIEE
jgi:hypothetical protein